MAILDNMVVSSIVGDVDTGGWTANCQLLNDQATAEYGRHVLVWHRTQESGVWPPGYAIALNASIVPKAVNWDRRMSSTEILLGTSHVFLQNAGLQGLFFTDQAHVDPVPVPPDAFDQHEIVTMTLGSIVKHIVEKHTNISQAAGGWVNTDYVQVANSTLVNVRTVRESNSIWSTLKEIGDTEFFVVFFRKDDTLVYDCHPQFAAVLADVTVIFDASMIIGAPSVTYNDLAVPDQVRLYALTDEGDTIRAYYPADITAEGRKHKLTNIRCNTQARLDQLAFRLFNFMQRRYQARITLPGAWGLQFELYDRVGMTYAGTAINGVSFNWANKKFWLSNITVNRLASFGAVSELTLEEEFFGEDYFYA